MPFRRPNHGQRLAIAGRPAEKNIPHVGFLPGIWRILFVYAKAKGGEEIARVISGRRRPAHRDVVATGERFYVILPIAWTTARRSRRGPARS